MRFWGLMAFALWGAQASAEIVEARYDAPTTRYAHGVLGDDVEYGALVLKTKSGTRLRLTLPDTQVFEDIAPRLIDLDHDGEPEVVTILSDARLGAALAIYGEEGLITKTPHIGRAFRWLAPLGAGDLYGDGDMILAYVDRPHLAKVLRLWRYKDRRLTAVDSVPNLTAHAIGHDYISGGIVECGNGDEVIAVDANWTRVMSIVFTDGAPVIRPLTTYKNRATMDAALACKFHQN
ncbi:MAG: VCBS repeat-containing protein [Halocynthiibacter sp.]